MMACVKRFAIVSVFLPPSRVSLLVCKPIVGTATPRKKHELFAMEQSEFLRSAEEKIKEGTAEAQYFTSTRIEHVRPMLDICWPPLVAALSSMLDRSDNDALIALCLEGLHHGIHISCLFYMDMARQSLINCLWKFTFLEPPKEMKKKNLDCVKALVNLAFTEGNRLQSEWMVVLNAISQIERLHVIAAGVKEDDLDQYVWRVSGWLYGGYSFLLPKGEGPALVWMYANEKTKLRFCMWGPTADLSVLRTL